MAVRLPVRTVPGGPEREGDPDADDEPARRVVSPHRGRGDPHAHRLGRDLRGSRARPRRGDRGRRRAAAARPPLPPEGAVRPARPRPARRGSTTRTSTSSTTCATRRCRRPAASRSCATSSGGSCPSSSIATSRCGRCGSSRVSSDGRWALVSKTHHCMVDGVSATDLLSVILSSGARAAEEDRTSRGSRARAERGRAGGPLAGPAGSQPVRGGADGAWPPPAGPRRVATQAWRRARGLVNFRSLLSPTAAASTLNGPIGPHRRWDWARAGSADIKQIRQAHGGTINDVVLAAITTGFRELLLSRGEPVEGRIIRTLVPVSVRAKDEKRRLRQQGLGHVRRASGRDRRPCRARSRRSTTQMQDLK